MTQEEIKKYLNSRKSKEQLICEIETLKEKIFIYRQLNIKLKYEVCDLKEANLDLTEANLDLKEANLDLKEVNLDLKSQIK